MAAGLLLGPWIFDADGNGAPFVGGLLTTYLNHTTTPQATYTSAALTVPLANPIVADGNGRFPDIWADTSKTFSIKWTKPDGTLIATYDDRIPLGPSDSASFALVGLSNVTPADGLAAGQAWGLTGQAFRNRVINGEMSVNGRTNGAAISLATGARTYAFDRFSGRRIAAGGGATLQWTTGGPTSFPFCAVYIQTTGAVAAAADQAFIETLIEGNHVPDALLGTSGAQYLAVRFSAQANITGKYSFYIQNADRTRSYVNTYTVDVANAWQDFAIVIPGDQNGTWPTDTPIGLIVGWDCGSGSNFEGADGAWAGADRRRTSDSVKISASSTRQLAVAKVQVAVVSASTLNPAFERRPYALETLLTKRYYRPLPGSQASGGAGPTGYRSGTTLIYGQVAFDLPMRIAPTLSASASTWANATDPLGTSNITFFDAASGAFLTITGALTLSASRASTMGSAISAAAGTSFNGTAGDAGFFTLGSALYIGFDADYT